MKQSGRSLMAIRVSPNGPPEEMGAALFNLVYQRPVGAEHAAEGSKLKGKIILRGRVNDYKDTHF